MSDMGIKTFCAAIHGENFKTTVNDVKPDGSINITRQADHRGCNPRRMAQIIHEEVRPVLRAQAEINRERGKNYASPVIMGWPAGTKFNGVDDAIRFFRKGHRKVRDEHRSETEKGLFRAAVQEALEKEKLPDGICLPFYRAVQANQTTGQINPQIESMLNPLLENFENITGTKKEIALKQLITTVYSLGFEIGRDSKEQMIAYYQGRDVKITDPTRFIKTDFFQGPKTKNLFKLAGLRAAFANGFRDGMQIDQNHIMVIKSEGLDTNERPLVNIAGAMAFEQLVKSGDMPKEKLPEPYV